MWEPPSAPAIYVKERPPQDSPYGDKVPRYAARAVSNRSYTCLLQPTPMEAGGPRFYPVTWPQMHIQSCDDIDMGPS